MSDFGWRTPQGDVRFLNRDRQFLVRAQVADPQLLTNLRRESHTSQVAKHLRLVPLIFQRESRASASIAQWLEELQLQVIRGQVHPRDCSKGWFFDTAKALAEVQDGLFLRTEADELHSLLEHEDMFEQIELLDVPTTVSAESWPLSPNEQTHYSNRYQIGGRSVLVFIDIYRAFLNSFPLAIEDGDMDAAERATLPLAWGPP